MSLADVDAQEFAGTSRFQVLRVLGRGGVGVVYEAFDRELNARVALKTLRVASPEALLRFKQEFRTLQDLDHPNLVRLGELIEEAGTWFFTMDLVEGVDLLSYVRLGPADHEGDTPTAAETPTPNPALPTFMTPPSTPRTATPPPTPPRPASLPDVQTGDTMSSGPVPEPRRELAPRSFSPTRLRHAFAQLADGLDALHRAQLVHRDVKPSNVLVTREGRVVILDFGLTAEVADVADEGKVGVGTLAFMAPEQWLGALPRPASDWYAVGVALYLALTGSLPFGGKSRQEQAWKKLNATPPRPRELCVDIPDDLEELCLALMQRDPAERPDGAEVVRRLGEPARAAQPGHSAGFVGREAELAELGRAFADSRTRTVGVLVTGDSGIGKSALVRAFRESLAQREQDLHVLAGRCHERESVPYKAVDGVVDALSRRLRRLPADEVAPLLPAWIGALAQVFPVLRQIEAVAARPAPEAPVERTELHRRVFGALRELLVRVGERWPLVVLVDDLQWADADSLALLEDILRPPGPRLLLVATQRGPAESGASLGEVELRRVHVSPLPAAQALELATRWLGEVGAARPELADALAREAGGHPMFIAELAQHAGEGDGSPAGSQAGPAQLRLDEALRQRIARLDEPARRVLELAAVAGVPLSQSLLAQIAEMPFAEFARHAATLRAGHLLKTSGPRPSNRAEPYHDRISESLRARLPAERARAWHGRLARALEPIPGSAPELLSGHWEGAGEPRRAAAFAERAAEEAARALAFERSVRMVRRALALVGADDPVEVQRLEILLAGALVAAGRSAEAAEVYARAASRARGQAALDLRRRAGEAYLVSGRVDEGMAIMTSLLEQVGMKLPRTRAATLLGIGLARLHFKLRGLGTQLVAESEVAPQRLLEMDVAWTAGMGLAYVDIIQSTWFQQKFLLLALRTGERRRLMRGLICEAILMASGGSRTAARTDAILARIQELGEAVDTPYDRGWVASIGALCAYLEGRFPRTLELAAFAVPYLGSAGYSSSWELDTMRVMQVTCELLTGQTRAAAERYDEYLRAARDRGDHYEGSLLRTGIPNRVWLLRGDVATARRMAGEALAGWSKRGTILHSLLDLTAQLTIDLYEGQAEAAWQRVNRMWRGLRAAYILDYQVGRVECLDMRARAALALALAAQAGDGARARELRGIARRDAARIRREGQPPALGYALAIEAGLAAQAGDESGAALALRAAAEAFESASMRMHAATARARLGGMLGGDQGRAMTEAAEAALRAQAVAAPERWMAVLTPGLDPG